MYLFLRLEFIGWHPIVCCFNSFYHFPDPLIMLSIGGTGTMLHVISGGISTSCAGTGAGSLSRQLITALYPAPSQMLALSLPAPALALSRQVITACQCHPGPGPTRLHHGLGPHDSLLPWAQSATDAYIVQFHPSDGTDIPSIFTE